MRVALKLTSIAVALTLACFIACSDDDDPPPKEAGTPDIAVTDKGPAGEGTVGDKGPMGEAPVADAPAGACTAADDKAAVDGTKKWGDKTILEITSGQAACLTDPNPEDCITTAVQTATNSEVSEPCVRCYAKNAMCTVGNCMLCVATPPPDANCVKCMCGDNTAKVSCVQAFADCAGVPGSLTCP